MEEVFDELVSLPDSALDFDGIGNTGTGRYAVGPVITWPLLNLGRVKANVDAAKGLEAEARARYEQTVLLAREEIESSRVAYTKARERLTELEAAARASSRAAELARLRFEGGVTDFRQVLDAQRSLLITQDQLARGRTDAVNALVSGPLRARAAAGEYKHHDAMLRPDEIRQELDESGFDLVSLVGVQHRYNALVACQVYVAPRADRLAGALMYAIDKLGGEPLEWVVVCRRR